ncbi:MAG: hypothetical protein ACKOEC_03420 [Acidimicrobiia bacterium]
MRTLALLLVLIPTLAHAQKIDVGGEVSVLGMTMPNQPEGGGKQELRSRARLEVTADPTSWLRLKFDGSVDGLVADRSGRVNDAIARARDAWVEVRGSQVDVRVGYGRLVWGRLDEIMPSDVLNPVESARYFLEGRSEARLPVAFARTRLFFTDDTSLEAIVSLPGRRGRFDELDEASSPFNLLRDLVLPAGLVDNLDRREPKATWSSLQGGGRLSTTLGRVDASVSAYRGCESFGTVSLEPSVFIDPTILAQPIPLVVGTLVERYARFTMVAADAEAIVGPWAIRAETAYFPDRAAIDAGVGVDRSAGDYRVFTSVVWHRDWSMDGPTVVNHDFSLIGSIERRFARDRYMVRVFGVSNPVDASGFVRGVAAWTVRDNVALEVSGGAFFGEADGTDTLSRFRDRDFAFARVRWFF